MKLYTWLQGDLNDGSVISNHIPKSILWWTVPHPHHVPFRGRNCEPQLEMNLLPTSYSLGRLQMGQLVTFTFSKRQVCPDWSHHPLRAHKLLLYQELVYHCTWVVCLWFQWAHLWHLPWFSPSQQPSPPAGTRSLPHQRDQGEREGQKRTRGLR